MKSNFPVTIKITRAVVALLPNLSKNGQCVWETNLSVTVGVANAFAGERGEV